MKPLLKLRQVYFDYDQKLDPGCTPYNAVGKEPITYENQHIIDLVDAGDHETAEYWGLTSWRMAEKTKLNFHIIEQEIKDNPGYDVYLYYDYGSDKNLLQNKDFPIGKIIKRLYKLGVIPYENKKMDWVRIFCNYWIARPEVINKYARLLKKVIKTMETDPVISGILKTEKFNHRGRKYPYHPFVLEYLFGLFLLHNPKIKYLRIPNMKSLAQIYENHKADAGWGDKGTLHHYIESYDRLFTPFRDRPINILEIGVCKGDSVKMWREYFKHGSVYGIDVNLPEEQIPGVTLYQCDQTDRARLDELFKDVLFDIIIDDGSHKIQHQLLTAKYMWNKMKSGGLYVIEDIQEPEIDIQTLSLGFRQPTEVIDTRDISGRYDDILMVWKK